MEKSSSLNDGILLKFSRKVKLLFPPFSQKSILRHYIPLSGAISHSIFTLNIFNPLILFPINNVAISNSILFNAHLGLGFYIWRRVEYCVFSSVLFNFGSILLSIFLRDFLPKRCWKSVRCFLGISLSFFLLHRTRLYVHYIDKRTILSGMNKRKINNNISTITTTSPSPSV